MQRAWQLPSPGLPLLERHGLPMRVEGWQNTVGPHSWLLTVNACFCAITGYPRDVLLNSSFQCGATTAHRITSSEPPCRETIAPQKAPQAHVKSTTWK
jgi:hypothetical protein